ncbi:MAG: Fe-S cluster assembly protein SufD [Dysgonamonadaceae bacterium]|jgi:Fe-S cluster assembly protein SufD|nr:Fe-S cluster assembly protein SufD [Dysgonamonadaceae bacterium]
MQQYIDLFTQHKSRIEASCAPLLNQAREQAFETFRRTGFPAYRSEDYTHTDVPGLLQEDFGFYLNRPASSGAFPLAFHCQMLLQTAFSAYDVNGYFYSGEKNQPLPEGVFSGSLNVFAERYPELFSAYYHRLAMQEADGLAAFNTAFVQDGYVLYVPENVIIENPIQLTNLLIGNQRSLINRRLLLIFEPGAQAKVLVCNHTGNEQTAMAATQVCEIFAGKGSVVDFCEMEECSPQTIRLAAHYVRQESSSDVRIHAITLANGTTRNNYRVDLAGAHAELQLSGLTIADQRQRTDNYTVIHHQVPDCRSHELFQYLVEEQAIGAFSGRIIVAPGAQHTEAYQTNRNLLGSREARMYSKPQLEIYADDVKCSHGMSTGQIDETALFYMRSRGIPEAEARYLLKLAFTMDVLRGIRMEGLSDRLKWLVEKRFRGELIKCQGCI